MNWEHIGASDSVETCHGAQRTALSDSQLMSSLPTAEVPGPRSCRLQRCQPLPTTDTAIPNHNMLVGLSSLRNLPLSANATASSLNMMPSKQLSTTATVMALTDCTLKECCCRLQFVVHIVPSAVKPRESVYPLSNRSRSHESKRI